MISRTVRFPVGFGASMTLSSCHPSGRVPTSQRQQLSGLCASVRLVCVMLRGVGLFMSGAARSVRTAPYRMRYVRLVGRARPRRVQACRRRRRRRCGPGRLWGGDSPVSRRYTSRSRSPELSPFCGAGGGLCAPPVRVSPSARCRACRSAAGRLTGYGRLVAMSQLRTAAARLAPLTHTQLQNK